MIQSLLRILALGCIVPAVSSKADSATGTTGTAGTTGTTGTCPVWKGAHLSDLPLELLLLILGLLPTTDVGSFAMTCRDNYEIATVVLCRSVTIALQEVHSWRTAIDRKDPRIQCVHMIQLGKLDKPGYAEKWPISDSRWSSFLLAFSSLRTLEMCGGTFVRGWDGLDDLAALLGDRLTTLKATLFIPSSLESSPSILSRNQSFKILENLDLIYSRHHTVPNNSDISKLFHDISIRVKCLLQLHLHFIVSRIGRYDIEEDFPLFIADSKTTSFPSLCRFEFTFLNSGRSLQFKFIDLASFLKQHSKTLRHISIPSRASVDMGTINIDPPSALTSINQEDPVPLSVLNLVSLCANRDLVARLLLQGKQLIRPHISCASTALRELSIEFDFGTPSVTSFMPFEEVEFGNVEHNAREWPFKDIKRCTLINPPTKLDFRSIPIFCPNLEEFKIRMLTAVTNSNLGREQYDNWKEQRINMVEQLPKLRYVIEEYSDELRFHKPEGFRTEFRIIRDSRYSHHRHSEGTVLFEEVSKTSNPPGSSAYNYWTYHQTISTA